MPSDKRLSYWRELRRHARLLITGGVIAVVLALIAAYDLTREFFGLPQIPALEAMPYSHAPWLAVVVVLLFVCWVQHRMWADIRERLYQRTASKRSFRPDLDEGMTFKSAQPKSRMIWEANHPDAVVTTINVSEKKSERVIVTCDGRVSYASIDYYRPLVKRRWNESGACRITGEIIDMHSFVAQLPPGLGDVRICIEGEPAPAIDSIEWDPSTKYPKPKKQ